MNKIVNVQKNYFETGITKNILFRKEQLLKLRSALIEFEDEIYLALKKDLGKSKTEAYFSEVGFCLKEINNCIKNIEKWTSVKKVKSNKLIFPISKAYIKREPLGVVLIISPWNYPINLTISPLVGAIAAGNTIIIKPSEYSKNTVKVLDKMVSKYFDEKYIKLVKGGKKENQLLLKQKFDYIFFTGSTTVGKIVMKMASDNLIPVTLELGGKCPCVVDSHCDLEKTAKRIVYGKFINCGQTCIAPDYILVDKKIKNDLVLKLKETIIDFFGENQEKSLDYGRIINEKHFNRLKNYLKKTNILFGGKFNKRKLFLSPTIIDNCEKSIIMDEEIFGPILPIIEYNNLKEAINFISSKKSPLYVYIFSKNDVFINEILNNTKSGGICINDCVVQMVNNELPFGGVGFSGFGRYHGEESVKTFSNEKSVFENTLIFDVYKRFPPFDKKTFKMMKKFF